VAGSYRFRSLIALRLVKITPFACTEMCTRTLANMSGKSMAQLLEWCAGNVPVAWIPGAAFARLPFVLQSHPAAFYHTFNTEPFQQHFGHEMLTIRLVC